MKIYEIGESIRSLRKEHNLSQHELAEIAGISRMTLSKLENGKTSSVTINTLIRILERLGYEIDFKKQAPLPTLDDLRNKCS